MKKGGFRASTLLRGQSINRLLILSFVIVALLPVSILGINSYQAAWKNAWREVREKHLALAENLAMPISQYLDNRRIAISQLRERVEAAEDLSDPARTALLLGRGLDYLSGFRAVFLIDDYLRIVSQASSYSVFGRDVKRLDLGPERFLDTLFDSRQTFVSPVVMNPYTGNTTILIGTHLKRRLTDGRELLLVGELKIGDIEALRRSIRFGKQGHAAIVDQLGRVIAHPNPDWMGSYIKDLSNLSIVKRMMAGGTGVTEFYSPFKKADMVAGYTTVPKVGWGVMVPQPKDEVVAQIGEVRRAQLLWALVGLLLALAFAVSLAHWITRPLDILAKAGQRLHDTNFESELPQLDPRAPREILQLSDSLGGTVAELIASRSELAQLNATLKERVEIATRELRRSNEKLEHLAQSDHLTQLANRRHFEQVLSTLGGRRQGDNQDICILLLDVDKFKDINDRYGHAAGDEVLVQIATILRRGLRDSDLAARYAGDEFVVLLRADLTIGRQRARELRDAIDEHHFQFDGQALHTTVSIGLAHCSSVSKCRDPEELLHQVDVAMYEAKRQGRNRVAEVEYEGG